MVCSSIDPRHILPAISTTYGFWKTPKICYFFRGLQALKLVIFYFILSSHTTNWHLIAKYFLYNNGKNNGKTKYKYLCRVGLYSYFVKQSDSKKEIRRETDCRHALLFDWEHFCWVWRTLVSAVSIIVGTNYPPLLADLLSY